VRQSIGADSLGYLSREGMIAATNQPEEKLCTACFTGKYPIELPVAERMGKNLLERGVATIHEEGHVHVDD
jgi:amidophosphoribosyltransferase